MNPRSWHSRSDREHKLYREYRIVLHRWTHGEAEGINMPPCLSSPVQLMCLWLRCAFERRVMRETQGILTWAGYAVREWVVYDEACGSGDCLEAMQRTSEQAQGSTTTGITPSGKKPKQESWLAAF
ncbi:hypothetical protein B0H14DRAFT_2646198 [Mycena olivaceomarginata]|nr:hypothetical protein B0H14DRAFT_2646198 [Mycena olivaceomarginata]